MEHVVFYQSSQGTPAFRRMASLEDAVSFAEHLRNVEGVTDFSVYSLSPVSLSLRAYYHVEVSRDGSRTVARPASTEAAPEPQEHPAPDQAAAQQAAPDRYAVPAQPDDDPVDEGPIGGFGEPADPPAMGSLPFVAGPTATRSAPSDTFVKDDPVDLPEDSASAAPEQAPSIDRSVVDPSVMDPTTEEVVPVPPGRRSMGFFARS